MKFIICYWCALIECIDDDVLSTAVLEIVQSIGQIEEENPWNIKESSDSGILTLKTDSNHNLGLACVHCSYLMGPSFNMGWKKGLTEVQFHLKFLHHITFKCLVTYFFLHYLLQQDDPAWNPPHSRRDRVRQHEVPHYWATTGRTRAC